VLQPYKTIFRRVFIMAYKFQIGEFELPDAASITVSNGASINTSAGDIVLGTNQVDSDDIRTMESSKFAAAGKPEMTLTYSDQPANNNTLKFEYNSLDYIITFLSSGSTSVAFAATADDRTANIVIAASAAGTYDLVRDLLNTALPHEFSVTNTGGVLTIQGSIPGQAFATATDANNAAPAANGTWASTVPAIKFAKLHDGGMSERTLAQMQGDLQIDDALSTMGVDAGETHLGTFTGATIADNVAVKVALQSLETKVEAVQTDVDGNEAAADTAIAANDADISDIRSAAGIADGAQDMGTYAGSTISDNQTAKQNMGELEAAVESKHPTIDASARLSATLIGANGNVSDTEYGYLASVTSDIQTQLGAKHPTIDSSARLSATLIGANGNVSDTEYGYLASVTSDIQTQLNSAAMTKANLTTLLATYELGDTLTIGDAGNDMTLVVKGTLQVDGTTTTVNSVTVTIDDKNIELGSTASPDDAGADGGGITLKGTTDKTISWVNATDAWTSNQHFELLGASSDYRIDGTDVLSKTALGTGVLASSLTSVGTIGTGAWEATDVAVAHGGTGASSASAARTNLGLVIGTDVQAFDAELAELATMASNTAAALADLSNTEVQILDGALISTAELNMLDKARTAQDIQAGEATIDPADGHIVVILATASSETYTLPATTAALEGQVLRIKNAGEYAFTLAKNASDTANSLEGEDSITLNVGAAISCICIMGGDATREWFIM
jgi:hypothetical protein